MLTSDDARDLFKRSFDSQGATFLQTHLLAVRKHAASKAKAAANVLRRTGVQAADLRLVTLASKVEKGKQSPTDFSAVTKDLEDMLADLVQEEKDDAKEIDTNTATVDRLNKEIAEANKRIEESDAEIADLNKAQQDADDQRAKEATEYASAKADDKKAKEATE